MSTLFILRPSYADPRKLRECALPLVGNTVYQKQAKCEDAPIRTDCLTAIHYIFKTALRTHIPVTYIGDMPRQLASYSAWRPLNIKRENVRCGDLFFVKRIEKERLITHVAMFLDSNTLFHSNYDAKTAVTENFEEFQKRYDQTLNFRRAVRYIDSRNTAKRDEEKGRYIQNDR
jgi:cell wall-associated NlpC family hydrolase